MRFNGVDRLVRHTLSYEYVVTHSRVDRFRIERLLTAYRVTAS